jgi:hypothetical protein
VALGGLLLALWSLTHRYRGLGGDAGLYAVQALARLHPNLGNDLFLAHTSQDTYTIFSPFYAVCIALLGLHTAALTLTVLTKLWFFVAAWFLARGLSDVSTAFLAVAVLVLTGGSYGAYHVFHYAEDWFTARSVAEALVLTALALHFHGARVFGLLAAGVALLLHPLMGLPGVVLLLSLRTSFRLSMAGAALGVFLALAIALVGVFRPSSIHVLQIMDASWLEIVRERSQFLFLQLWRAADWADNARPFLSLTLCILILEEPRARRLGASALLIGATGLAVGLLGSLLGPVSVLLQGQTWRWVWVTSLIAVLLSAPCALRGWKIRPTGPACALLMLCGWMMEPEWGAACMIGALLLWLARNRVPMRYAGAARCATAALGVLILAAQLYVASPEFGPSMSGSSSVPGPAMLSRQLLRVELLAAAITGVLYAWIRTSRSVLVVASTGGALLVVAGCALPETFRDQSQPGTKAQIEEFSDWREAIPPASNVFVIPAHNSAAFAWFTLGRPSYLTVDQSSGVVFSRATALEVRRRAQVLLPLMEPDWKLMSELQHAHSANGSAATTHRALTRDRLILLCGDPAMDFIVARENVGFQPLHHTQRGAWQNWNLYDCRRVNGASPSS